MTNRSDTLMAVKASILSTPRHEADGISLSMVQWIHLAIADNIRHNVLHMYNVQMYLLSNVLPKHRSSQYGVTPTAATGLKK